MTLRIGWKCGALALAAACCALSWAQEELTQARERRAQRSAALAEKARELNAAVLRLQGEALKADERGRRALKQEADGQLRERAQALRELARQDPAEALRLTLAEETLARLRRDFHEQAALLERHGEWEGPVETLVFDGLDLDEHDVVHFLDAGGETLEVRLAGEQPEGIECGARTRFRGVRIGEVVAAMDAEVTAAAEAAAAPACGPRGPQHVAVLLVTFPGVAAPSGVTPASVHSVLFGNAGRSLHGYWNEASYGQVTATGTVYGWYTLDRVYSCSEYGAMRSAAIAAADAEVDFSQFNRLFILFPNPGSCSWAGLSNVGCGSFSSAEGTIRASSSWMLAHYFSNTDNAVKLSAHEGGHALGLMHSRSRRFTGEPLGNVGDAGAISEYGDVHSAMGSWNLGHYTVEQKIRLGWLPTANVQQVQTAGTYVVKPIETPAGGTQALQVLRGTGNSAWLWLEFRQPLGNYDTALNSQVFTGALIHYRDSNTGSFTDLLDFTPSTSSFHDAALAAGRSWQDPYTNLTLAVTGASASGLTVNVHYGPVACTEAAPTITLSPPNPSAEPGKSASYTVSLRNNDSSGCGSRTFNLSSTKPQGWTTAFSQATVALAPGQSLNVTMTKTVPSSTAPGTYAVDALAQTQAASVSAAANLTVVAPPPAGPLEVTLLRSASSATVRTTVSFTARVLSGGAPAAGAAVTFYLRKPDATMVTRSGLKTDSKGAASWSYRFQNFDPRGVYFVTALVSYKGVTASATTTVTLQ